MMRLLIFCFALVSVCTAQRDVMETVTDMLHQLKEEFTSGMREIQQQVTEQQQEITEIKENLAKHKQALQMVDASFTAYASSATYAIGDIVRFESILRNDGDNYNPLTGFFTCPVSGYYLFYIGLNMINGMVADIYVQGEPVLSEAYSYSNYNHGSTLSVSYCIAGERVFVRCTVAGDIYSVESNRYSVFSGALLQQNTAALL